MDILFGLHIQLLFQFLSLFSPTYQDSSKTGNTNQTTTFLTPEPPGESYLSERFLTVAPDQYFLPSSWRKNLFKAAQTITLKTPRRLFQEARLDSLLLFVFLLNDHFITKALSQSYTRGSITTLWHSAFHLYLA